MEFAPLRRVTDEEIAAYEREGFVKLSKILPQDWVEELRIAIDEMVTTGHLTTADLESVEKSVVAHGGTLLNDQGKMPVGRFIMANMVRSSVPRLDKLCVGPPLPTIAAQILKASKINVLHDQIFLKEPGATRRTAFHSDESYFPFTGEQCATFWIPVDVVGPANGPMGYVPRSHEWRTKFKRNVFVSQTVDPTSQGENLPDIESDEEGFGVVYVEAEPGDIIVHHYRTIHGSRGNTDPLRFRRSAALRYGGDDLRYTDRYDLTRNPHLKEGDIPDSEAFPVVWRAP